jgi:hypothetical protein
LLAPHRLLSIWSLPEVVGVVPHPNILPVVVEGPVVYLQVFLPWLLAPQLQ